MDALRRDIRNGRGEERLVDAAPSPGPLFDFGIAHRGRDPQAAVACLQRRDFLLERIFARVAETQEQMNVARPICVGKIARHAHQRRQADAAADQDDALFLLAHESEGSVRSHDFEEIAWRGRVMEPT